ncbi:hypothetical protein C9439_04480 [archaeon SCG-AAA382B04]|nr:hypothetical protein C9439_04480 [archaeon SCG-AAA382B04]
MGVRLKDLVFFAGKGGVGKTTCSVTYSIKCAENGAKTLVTSTDPAHSISHLLERDLSDNASRVMENLFAREIDPAKEAKRHKERIMGEMREVISPNKISSIESYLDMAHNSPGVRESAMLDAIIDTIKNEEFDKLVFDTAPTGQTIRLLELPEILDKWVERLVGRRKKDLKRLKNVDASEIPGESLITRLVERRDRLEFARDKIVDESSLIPVLTPQKLSLEETKEGVQLLEEIGVEIPGVIVNKFDKRSEEAREYQEERIMEIRDELDKDVLGKIPRMETEIIGIGDLKKTTQYLEID